MNKNSKINQNSISPYQHFIKLSTIFLKSKVYSYIKVFFILLNIWSTLIMNPNNNPGK